MGIMLLLILALGGCATTEQLAPDSGYLAHPGTVAVVATGHVPEIRFEGFVRGRAAGAAAGAGGTLGACVGGMGGGGCSGSFCGAAIILMLGICGIAGLVGGVAGAATAPSADQVSESEAAMSRAFEVSTIQNSLRNAVVDAAVVAGIDVARLPEGVVREAVAKQDYRSLAGYGADTVLETSLTRAGTSGTGINDPSSAYMQVHVRLVDTSSNEERFASDYLYQGRSRDLAGWAANQARPLIDELEHGYSVLGSHISESVFLQFRFPDRSPHSAGGLSAAFGLAPIYPPTRGTLTGDRYIGAIFEWYAVESLRPHFKWEAFPRQGDIAAAPEEMARVGKVEYDLVIASEENMAPGEIVYRQYGLASPEHTIRISLQPGRRYFWTVRSRFVLDGRIRVTEWSSTLPIASENITAPSRYSFRFRTP